MSRFLETICIRDGQPMHLEWHQRRLIATLQHFYPNESSQGESFDLAEIISSCVIPSPGVIRCRVEYDLHIVSVEFIPYVPREIQSLKLVDLPSGFDYSYKYVDRRSLDELFARRGEQDDILMLRDGWITDTSVGNIAFCKNDRGFTPAIPLLAGTTWKRLVSSGVLIPRSIHHNDLLRFDAFKIFNAMNDWSEVEEHSVRNIGGVRKA
jgi:4-amino-4-deoxychorismate lyase